MKNSGTFYIVATPIGNLGDISMRAIEILRTVDFVLAEDTRHSGNLLKHFDIKTKMLSLHEYNEKDRCEKIITLLKSGINVALICDAGTPLISDPGFYLVKNLQEENIKVVPIPGACAAITALCASGVASDKFIFLGFLSAKKTARLKELEEYKNMSCTMIFYEAPHRIFETISDMATIFSPQRDAVIARELTKIYEDIKRGSLEELLLWLTMDTNNQRGEFVIIVSKEEKENINENTNALNVLNILLKELPLKQAVKIASEITNANKNDLYKIALKQNLDLCQTE